MTNQDFLSENRVEIIKFYNEQVTCFWTISKKDFMIDLLSNFRKVTISDGLKRMDLVSNLKEAKMRLGVFTKKITMQEDRTTNALKRKYKGTAYMALV